MKAEQQAEEILVEKGFADPEDLEPEMVELLKKAVEEGKATTEELVKLIYEGLLRSEKKLIDWLKKEEGEA